jgi:hypothetical protein
MTVHQPGRVRRQYPEPEVRNITRFAIPTKVGTHFGCGYRPEFILGPRKARTRGPVWAVERIAKTILTNF